METIINVLSTVVDYSFRYVLFTLRIEAIDIFIKYVII